MPTLRSLAAWIRGTFSPRTPAEAPPPEVDPEDPAPRPWRCPKTGRVYVLIGGESNGRLIDPEVHALHMREWREYDNRLRETNILRGKLGQPPVAYIEQANGEDIINYRMKNC